MGTGPETCKLQSFYGERLYRLLNQQLSIELSAWCAQLLRSPDFFTDYLMMWSNFKSILEHFESVFSYLERFWIDQQYEPYKDSGDREGSAAFFIRQLLYHAWAKHVLIPCKAKLYDCLESIWTGQLAPEHVCLGVESIKMLSVPIKIPHRAINIETGINLFETELLPWYYQRLTGLCLARRIEVNSLAEVAQLMAWWEEERRRSICYLGREALKLTLQVLKEQLLEPAMPQLLIHFRQHLLTEQDPTEALGEIYKLIALRPSLLSQLASCFEAGLKDRASVMQSSLEQLYQLYLLSDQILLVAMADRSEMRQARDNAFKVILCSPYTPLKLAEWSHELALSNDVDRLEVVVRLLAYISDKHAFQQAYQRYFAERLLSGKYFANLEQHVIAKLKSSLGGVYSQPLERMMSDIFPLPAGDNIPSRKRTKAANSLPEDFATQIITQGVWPVEKVEQAKSIILSPSFLRSCRVYEENYKMKHPKRILYWHPVLSTAEIEFNDLYHLKVNLMQLAVLEPLLQLPNEAQDPGTLSVKSGLPPSLVVALLSPFISVGLVLKLSTSELYQVNSGFTFPQYEIDFTQRNHYPTTHHNEHSCLVTAESSSGRSDQIHVIQAAIMRYLKEVTEDQLTHIIIRVNTDLAQRYSIADISALEIEQALDGLVSREFVQRVHSKTLRYIP